MPRKKKSENLRHKNVITLKLTDAELELLDHSAKILGLSRSEFLRKSFLEKDIQLRYEIVADMDELRKLVSEYGKIGSNTSYEQPAQTENQKTIHNIKRRRTKFETNK